MTYLIDKFDTPRMYQATFAGSTVLANGAIIPFTTLSGDTGLSVDAGTVTLTSGLYAVMCQVLFDVEETTARLYLNGEAIPFERSEPAATYPSLSLSSNNQTMVAVFRANEGDLLTARLVTATGGSSTCYGSDCDLTILKTGAA
jgi:hypothetical protein